MTGLEFEGLGTKWTILLDHEVPGTLKPEIQEIIIAFENQYSRFKATSEISQLKYATSPYPLTSELEDLLSLGLKLQRLTLGHFNLNIESLLSGVGYDSAYSFSPDERLLKLPLTSFTLKNHQLIFDTPPRLDLGALGKGYLIDKIGKFLTAQGFKYFLIDGGGDLFGTSKQDHSPWKIALEHPTNPAQAIGSLTLHNQAIATSSSAKRKFKDFHHLLNPITKRPVNRLLSISILSSQAFRADALATALFISPTNIWPELVKEFNFDYLAIYPDFQVSHTPAFANLF